MEKFLKDLMPTMEKEGQKIAQDFIDRQKSIPAEDGEKAFVEDALRGEREDVPDRFTGSAITSISPNTPEQQRIVDEWNARHGGE